MLKLLWDLEESYQNGIILICRTCKALRHKGFPIFLLIPTRCRDLHLKQFCLEDIAPAVLIILITHILIAVRWMLIKILSAVINHHGTVTTVVSGGCHPNKDIIRKTSEKINLYYGNQNCNTCYKT